VTGARKIKDLRRRAVGEEEPHGSRARMCAGRQFHNKGPAEAKAHCEMKRSHNQINIKKSVNMGGGRETACVGFVI